MYLEWRARLEIKLHRKPKQLATLKVIGDVENTRTIFQTILPAAFDFNSEHAGAAWANFVLMGHRRRSKGERKGPELHIAMAIFLRIVAAKKQAEKRQLMRVGRKLTGLGVP